MSYNKCVVGDIPKKHEINLFLFYPVNISTNRLRSLASQFLNNPVYNEITQGYYYYLEKKNEKLFH